MWFVVSNWNSSHNDYFAISFTSDIVNNLGYLSRTLVKCLVFDIVRTGCQHGDVTRRDMADVGVNLTRRLAWIDIARGFKGAAVYQWRHPGHDRTPYHGHGRELGGGVRYGSAVAGALADSGAGSGAGARSGARRAGAGNASVTPASAA